MDDAPGSEQALYHLGMHFLRYRSAEGVLRFIPTMQGSGENQVVLYPNGLVSIIAGKDADAVVDGQPVKAGDYSQTLRVLDRLGPLPRSAPP